MSDAHNALITQFYQAFQRLDAEAMSACYTDDVVFSDPAFGELRGRDAGDMWRMLTTRAKDFSLTFDNVRSDERTRRRPLGGDVPVQPDRQHRGQRHSGTFRVSRRQDLRASRQLRYVGLVPTGAGFQGAVVGLDAGGEKRRARSGLEGAEGIPGQSLIRSRLVSYKP